MTLENKYNRGTHGDSSHMLSTVVLSNENQTCRGWEAPTSTGGGGCHLICYSIIIYFFSSSAGFSASFGTATVRIPLLNAAFKSSCFTPSPT